MKRRTMLTVLGGGLVSVTGCLGRSDEEPASGSTESSPEAATETETPTGTATPLPPGEVEFPGGPKDVPSRPAELTEETVRDYVRAYEYRYAYNSLWFNEYSDVNLDCRVDSVTSRQWGYEVVVTCTGFSNTNVPENATVTPGPHADWFTQSYRYRVSEDATHRVEAERRDPVS